MGYYSVDMTFDVDVQDVFDELPKEKKEEFIKERLGLISDSDIADEIENRGIYDYLKEDLMVEQLELVGYKVEKE
ncbi:MAG: hypothetical protein IJ776_09355 [Paludibacteraceae bacterium]|nr:hypothetical protein [Paludibacteraceae bacterium]